MKKTILILVNLIMFIAFTNCSNIDQRIEMVKNKKINKSSEKLSVTSNENSIRSINEEEDSLPLIVGAKELKALNNNLNDINKSLKSIDDKMCGMMIILSNIAVYICCHLGSR